MRAMKGMGWELIGAVVCFLAACSSEKTSDDGASQPTDAGREVGKDSGGGGSGGSGGHTGGDGNLIKPACTPSPQGGSTQVQKPTLFATLFDSWHEAWLGSAVVADVDGDGTKEIVVARGSLVLGWHLDGQLVRKLETEGGRIWSSPVVADLVGASAGLEIAAASRDSIYLWDAQGKLLPGFPFVWRDELRSLAAADIDGDGDLELVAVTTSPLSEHGQRDIIIAIHADGRVVDGFPPNTSGASGCDDACYVTGGFDQNLALGDVDGDGKADILAPQDNAYMSLHRGNGEAFDAAPIFKGRKKFPGIRFLHDYAQAQQGWAQDEATSNQAHFTNSAPALADIDGDGTHELIVLASVQNASQDDRLRGVALWVLKPDGTRPGPWVEPFHVPGYLAGLWDFEGTNVVGATNQVTVADIDSQRPGPEFLFAGFDGKIHCVDASRNELWQATYTTSDRVLTAGVVVADLSADGSPEIVFSTYSPDEGKSHLFVLDAAGNELHKTELPKRGAMPVPTIADVDGDGQLEIVVSLKDGESGKQQVLVYTVAGSSDNCLLWPTARGNDLRSAFIP
ncbi:MAG TPA: VCBS repeat-containing protein [Polyangiaceae bacterium]|mgnify:FL=1|nr:MAG: FG-GAP repeat protein [Deltaproteobacteria bacterium ADurb.Bin207]HNS99962.1 VCBS repeat-containing protein [Polyangiaceae bacterium]HNZ25531.1 VCBS repeat-containing protein [Polyangiaceae bacterium]HOD25610.1 VCBS repeat-containing protein [Polyangiaceae bacterium]HOE51856.1 VCBS repeat-containing protein [Polyangiaceae bacterium]